MSVRILVEIVDNGMVMGGGKSEVRHRTVLVDAPELERLLSQKHPLAFVIGAEVEEKHDER
jgi:actin-like ATPase involved in cell morphogenesis